MEKSIKNWDYTFADAYNKDTSRCYWFVNDEIRKSGEGKWGIWVAGGMFGGVKYSIGAEIKLLFDFEKDLIAVYLDDVKKHSCKLTIKRLWVGVALYNKGETIEMVQCRYD